MTREMLINTVQGQECRIAIVEDGRLEELYMERVSSASHVGNIYKARVTNVEPSIQAAFVDFGLVKNGFLHISDINPSYWPKRSKGGGETVGRKRAHRDRPPIQECLRRGQEVIVQLIKEGIGTKGPTMSTYLSIPGRLLVMMPGMSRLGVSRKIDDEESRDKARKIIAELNPPSDIGFIVRTAAIDRPKRDFQRDLNYLLRLWKSIKQRIAGFKSPCELYQESDLVTRTIRDVYNADIGRIICDSEDVARRAKEFLDVAMPRSKNVIELYVGKGGLFHDYGLESEIEKIYARRMELPSGGSLVFDQAEALVAIDVNSGRFRDHSDAETTATKTNTEAAREIARQLRLRDLGGVVVIDFIDMREERNRRTVEKVLRDEMRPDRAKVKVLKMSQFGIVEMTRQRVRPSLKQSIFQVCPHCQGMGLIKSDESQALLVLRDLQRAVANDLVHQIEVAVMPTVAHHLANVQRRQIAQMEEASGKSIIIKADAMLAGGEIRMTCTNSRGSLIAMEPQARPAQPSKVLTEAMEFAPPPEGLEFEEEEELIEAREQAQEAQGAAAGAELQAIEAQAAPEAPQPVTQPQPQEQPPQRPQGQRPQGQRPQGQRPQGQRPQGQRPQGQRPQGQRPQGQPQRQQGQPQRPQAAPPQAQAGQVPEAPVAVEGQARSVGEGAVAAGQGPGGGEGVQLAPGEQVPGKKRRRGRRGGKRHRKRREAQRAREQALLAQQAAAQGAPAQPAGQAPQEVPAGEVIHHGPASTVIYQPPEEQAPAEQAQAAPEEKAPQQAPIAGGEQAESVSEGEKARGEGEAAPKAAEAPAAPTRKPARGQGKPRARRKPRAAAHRQDKEYYEQNVRVQKQAAKLPKDEPVEDEEDEIV